MKRAVVSRCAQSMAPAVEGINAQSSAYWNLSVQQESKKGNVDGAFGVFRDMIANSASPNKFTYTTLMTACDRGGAWQRARDLLADLRQEATLANPRIVPDLPIFNSCLSAYARTGRYQEAMSLLNDMEKMGMTDCATYNCVVRACGNASKPDLAISVVEQMKKYGMRPDILTYNSLLTALKHEWKKATELYDKICSLNDPELPLPTVVTHSAIVQAYERQGNFEAALKVIHGMWERGEHPTPATYTLAMSACNRGQRADLAQDLHDQMQQRGIELSGPCMNAYRRSVAQRGQWQKTLSMLDNNTASSASPQAQSNRDLPKSDGECSDHFQNVTSKAAPDTENNVSKSAVTGTEKNLHDLHANTDSAKTDLCAFSITLQSLGSAGQIDKALELVRTTEAENITNAVLNGLLTGLSEYNKAQRAAEPALKENLDAGWTILEAFRARGVKICARGATALLGSVVSPKLDAQAKRQISARVVDELSKDGGTPDALCYAKLSTLSSTVDEKRFWARQAASQGLLPFWKNDGLEGRGVKIVDFHEIPPPFVKDVTRWALETCTPLVDLQLVCGRATHTPEQDKVFDEYGNKVSVLRESIIQALKDCEITMVCPVRRNAGRLMVPREELIRWRNQKQMATKPSQS